MNEPSVSILANRSRTIAIGITSTVHKRGYAHREGLVPGFTPRYTITRLVCVAAFPTMLEAIAREKQLNRWRREKKIGLIETVNPHWRDISEDWQYAG